MSEKISLQAEFDWTPVLDDSGEPYEYPGSMGFRIRADWERPALYRWRILREERVEAVAYGETDNLARTLAQFLNSAAPPPPIARVKSALSEQTLRGGRIYLDAMVPASLEIGGRSLGANSLSDANTRRILEQVLLYEARKSGIRLLNLSSAPDPRKLL